nr:hypothetical protein [Tanacetum cinerariifolium]
MRPPLRSSGPRPHGDSMRPSFRPAGHRPHGPSMNPRRPTMNGARPYKSFFQAPLYETRPFLKSSAVNNPYRAPWVPTVNRKFTTSSTKYRTADMGRKGKAACAYVLYEKLEVQICSLKACVYVLEGVRICSNGLDEKVKSAQMFLKGVYISI